MLIETQYDAGDKVWIIKPCYETGVVEVFDSVISSISVKKNYITYYLEDVDGDYLDSELQPYNTDITEYIKNCMEKIREKESEEYEDNAGE